MIIDAFVMEPIMEFKFKKNNKRMKKKKTSLFEISRSIYIFCWVQVQVDLSPIPWKRLL
jgi:hypothetical protein